MADGSGRLTLRRLRIMFGGMDMPNEMRSMHLEPETESALLALAKLSPDQQNVFLAFAHLLRPQLFGVGPMGAAADLMKKFNELPPDERRSAVRDFVESGMCSHG